MLRLGRWSAWAVFILGVLYLLTGLAWMLWGPAPGPGGQPVDPYLAVLEFLLVLTAPAMITLMAAVHAMAPRQAKAYSLSALACMSLAAGITAGVHGVRLVVLRRLDPAVTQALAPMLSFEWPSVAFALDLLAWDVFLGLSLLLAVPVFRGSGPQARVRRALIVAGMLCLAGALGPATGDMRLQILAIIGYAGGFPVACLFLAKLFSRGLPDGGIESG